MRSVTSDVNTAASSLGQIEVARHLTESVFILRQTIRNIREDAANGIAPSMLMPAESNTSLENGMVLLSLEPSSSTVESHIGPLDERLQDLERRLKDCGQWVAPSAQPKAPEYSIIDINDMKSATKLLEDIYQHSHPSKSPSPQSSLSKYQWKWDATWKEFYAEDPNQSSYIYLSRWRLNEQRQVWEHVSMNGANLEPESAAELLGSWDDWTWDPLWKEWHLDVSDNDGRTCVFSSRWQVQESGEWVHIGRVGNLDV